MKILPMENSIQHYPWGSSILLPKKLGVGTIDDTPKAELWMGAHPKAPSMITINGKKRSLLDIIGERGNEVLGPHIVDTFGTELPFLFKVLAVEKPLSIQAHPSKKQAEEGFDREDSEKIPRDAAHRNYKDRNHKPEIICALDTFEALCGFKPIDEIISVLSDNSFKVIAENINELQKNKSEEGLKTFFSDIMNLNTETSRELIKKTKEYAQKTSSSESRLVLHLAEQYPEDIGILSPYLLHKITLKAGEALFLPAGVLHAYIKGFGVELMANSDNVLRGGLTGKHIDVKELLRVLSFKPFKPKILTGIEKNGEKIYNTNVPDFKLSELIISKNNRYNRTSKEVIEILLCTEGNILCTCRINGESMYLQKGTSYLVPAAGCKYTLAGRGTVYKATVPE